MSYFCRFTTRILSLIRSPSAECKISFECRYPSSIRPDFSPYNISLSAVFLSSPFIQSVNQSINIRLIKVVRRNVCNLPRLSLSSFPSHPFEIGSGNSNSSDIRVGHIQFSRQLKTEPSAVRCKV